MNGGTNAMSNLQAACSHCNIQKGAAFFSGKGLQDAGLAKLPLFYSPIHGDYSLDAKDQD
jgi:hypothetical protein